MTISSLDKSILGTMEIETLQGSIYTFPDMNLEPKLKLMFQVESTQTLTLSNVSGAAMLIPTRIIQKVSFKGELVWEREKKASPA